MSYFHIHIFFMHTKTCFSHFLSFLLQQPIRLKSPDLLQNFTHDNVVFGYSNIFPILMAHCSSHHYRDVLIAASARNAYGHPKRPFGQLTLCFEYAGCPLGYHRHNTDVWTSYLPSLLTVCQGLNPL